MSSSAFAGEPAPRVAFVTSASGNGDLSSWPEAADGLIGLDAADSICVRAAMDAGLANPDSFVAWLSDSADDAYCRVHKLSGEKAANCGQGELPAAAGPWVRTDGVPVAESIEPLLSLAILVYVPLLVDEHGRAVANDRRAWSATGASGVEIGSSCSDWTSSSRAFSGSTPLHITAWWRNGSSLCDGADTHLICLETGAGPALDLPSEPDGNIAFLAGAFGTGDLSSWPDAAPGTSGIEAGDSICNARADASGLPWQGSYKAWLSDDAVDARDRFVSDGPWVRPDGFRIASSLADLTDGALFSSISLTDTGFYESNNGVSTGTDADGTVGVSHCNNWTSSSSLDSRQVGRSGHTTSGWTALEEADCSATNYSLYCLSDVDFPTRVAFVTSASGGAIFSEWPEADNGLVGLDAADSICVNAATDAGLERPDRFMAWVSDSTDDAYCRLHDRTGKKAANCNQKNLPVGAGPWVRTDGVPWAESIAEMLSPELKVYSPLNVDENGQSLARTSRTWTATSGMTGSLFNPETCSDWQVRSVVQTQGGGVGHTSGGWSSSGGLFCSSGVAHLTCLEKEPGAALKLPDDPGRLAFVTSAVGHGDLSTWADADPGSAGIEAGDSVCRNLAADAGLPDPETFRAWLSDATTDARDRFDADTSWVRLDGFRIAANLADLTDGALITAINFTELGEYLGARSVWTGTNEDGTSHTDHCGSWQSNAGSGRDGNANESGTGWTSRLTSPCENPTPIRRLYCLSNPPGEVIHEDGFEE